MPPKGKGKKRVQKKAKFWWRMTPERSRSLLKADQRSTSLLVMYRENTIDVQLVHPYIYQNFLAKSQRKSHSGGTLHVRLLLLQGTLHVFQACDI